MLTKRPLAVDYSQQDATSKFVQRPLIHSSHDAGWKNIHLAHYQLPAMEIPETSGLQHIICLPFFKQPTEVELAFDGKRHLVQHDRDETGCIEILPAYAPIKARWSQENDITHCYLDPTFLNHAAYESVNPERVEVNLTLKKPDPLVWQIILALTAVLENDPNNSCFYADSMATALAAHCLTYYSTRKHILMEYEDGLSKYKLKQAIEYINDRLLKQTEWTINNIAIECGFANPSHFAKCFRRYTGISPKQFRMI